MKKRSFVVIDSNLEEKKEYREMSLFRGFKSVAQWFRFLAKRDIQQIKYPMGMPHGTITGSAAESNRTTDGYTSGNATGNNSGKTSV